MYFDDPQAGNTLKDRRLRNELKEHVPVTVRTKAFPMKKGKTTVIVERKQFPLILGHAITVHRSQGSTLNYMKGDLDSQVKLLKLVRITNNQYHKGNFIPSSLVPEVEIKFYC